MIVKIFWQENCSRCPPVKKLGETLQGEGIRVDYHDIKTTDGLAEAMFYDVLSTPSLIITDDVKKEIAAWRGEAPKIEDVKKLLQMI